MIFFEWSEDYSVGDDEIDSQHKNLLGFLNKYYNAMNKGRGKNIMDAIFAEMKAYALYHFQSEEQRMEEAGYPDLDKHKKIHAAFVGKILEFEKKRDEGDLLVSVNLAKFLNSWLIEHIRGEDKKYSPYLTAK